MKDKELKLKVLEAMKQAMMADENESILKHKKPKHMLVIEKEAIAVPKEDLKDEESIQEDEDLGGGNLMERLMELRKAKKLG